MSRKIARNALWNVAGTLASLAVGLVALPVLLHALGAARLGIFTLALGLIGFSGLLDLGLCAHANRTECTGKRATAGGMCSMVPLVVHHLSSCKAGWPARRSIACAPNQRQYDE